MLSVETNSELKAGFLFKNKHFNTLFRFLFASEKVHYSRQRIETPDSDFIDIDCLKNLSQKVVIAIHGLEGSSESAYIKSLGKLATAQGYDLVAINLRGCSGVPNKRLYSYHSGKTEDIVTVLEYLKKNNEYRHYYLVGYSLGGNMVLKFMGEYANSYARMIKAAVGVSVPCDLKEAAHTIDASYWLYKTGFLRTLKRKAVLKRTLFKEASIDEQHLKNARTLVDFDHFFTAPANGFKDAYDYYKKNSCKLFIPSINKPSLLISALDDPFLGEKCYPYQEANGHPFFKMILPKYGGHVGFFESFIPSKNYWLETKIFHFFND